MEIFKNTISEVMIPLPADSANVSFEIWQDGSQVHTGNPTMDDDTAVVTIPYRFTTEDTTLSIILNFIQDGFNEVETIEVDVITPVISLTEIKSIISPNDTTQISDNRAKDIERTVRLAIQFYTGQVFGKYTGTLLVTGSGDTNLVSPRRIISLESVGYNSVDYAGYSYMVTASGWIVQRSCGQWLTIKQAPPDEVLTETGVIFDPAYPGYKFSTNVNYTLTGVFGYTQVPSAVTQAARILVNDYACNESLYRNRYLSDIRAADWRFAFDTTAYQGTGNVLADQILAEFTRVGMIIL